MQRAFTIIELSIALLVISIMISVTLVGASLNKTALFKSVMADFTQFEGAINNFKLSYGQLPGDITIASVLWPSCDSTPTNCNGNGNGSIDLSGTALTNEALRAWQQLNAAGFIQGNYSGDGTNGTYTFQFNIGTNVPQSKWGNNIGYFFDNLGSPVPVSISMGGFVNGNVNGLSSMSSMDAYRFDTKYDDGLIYKGKIYSYNGLTTSTYPGTPGDSNCTYTYVGDSLPHCKPIYITIIQDN